MNFPVSFPIRFCFFLSLCPSGQCIHLLFCGFLFLYKKVGDQNGLPIKKQKFSFLFFFFGRMIKITFRGVIRTWNKRLFIQKWSRVHWILTWVTLVDLCLVLRGKIYLRKYTQFSSYFDESNWKCNLNSWRAVNEKTGRRQRGS